MYPDDRGERYMVNALSRRLKGLIKAVGEVMQEMDQKGYTPDARAKLVKAVEDAQPKRRRKAAS